MHTQEVYMFVRHDFNISNEMPPKMFMLTILDTVAKLYCFLWERKSEDYKIEMSWKDISSYYNKNSFRTSLRKLTNQGLLSYIESKEGVLIEVVGWDEIDV